MALQGLTGVCKAFSLDNRHGRLTAEVPWANFRVYPVMLSGQINGTCYHLRTDFQYPIVIYHVTNVPVGPYRVGYNHRSAKIQRMLVIPP